MFLKKYERVKFVIKAPNRNLLMASANFDVSVLFGNELSEEEIFDV